MAKKTYKTPVIDVTRICADAWTEVVGSSGEIRAKVDPYFLDIF